jgi:hypothetical protein
MVCIALRTGDCDDGVKQAIATKLIALARAGERNPDILCEEALKDIRQPQQWATSEVARSSVLRDSHIKRESGAQHSFFARLISAAERLRLQSVLHPSIWPHVAAYPPGRVHRAVPPIQSR